LTGTSKPLRRHLDESPRAPWTLPARRPDSSAASRRLAVVLPCLVLNGCGGSPAPTPRLDSGIQPLSPAPATPATDRAALEALYQAAAGDNWRQNSGWLSPAPLAEWHGVETDEAGRVTTLVLSQNELKGTIPPEVGELSNLRRLELSGHFGHLGGTIPPELGRLSNLEHLDLSGNGLTGPIPGELGQLANLRRLDLASNGSPHGDEGLNGAIPPELGQLSNLEHLNLSHNHLTGAIPSELGQLSTLTELNLAENLLTGPIPPELGRLANLRVLDLGIVGSPDFIGRLGHGNTLSGPIPPELGQLVNLEYLNLAGNPLSGELPREFAQITGLSAVLPRGVCVPWGPPFDSWLPAVTVRTWSGSVPRCGPAPSHILAPDRAALETLYRATDGDNWRDNSGWLSAQPLVEWFGVSSADLADPFSSHEDGIVRLLDLSGNRLSGSIPSEIGQLVNLVSLYLFDNQLSGTIPAELGQLTRLSALDLSGNQLSGSIPPELGQLARLSGLDLSENRLSGTIPVELGQLGNLDFLDLSDNPLTGALPDSFLFLQVLSLDLSNTEVCAPADAAFDGWLRRVILLQPEPFPRCSQ